MTSHSQGGRRAVAKAKVAQRVKFAHELNTEEEESNDSFQTS